jgi:hypothetical protein
LFGIAMVPVLTVELPIELDPVGVVVPVVAPPAPPPSPPPLVDVSPSPHAPTETAVPKPAVIKATSRRFARIALPPEQDTRTTLKCWLPDREGRLKGTGARIVEDGRGWPLDQRAARSARSARSAPLAQVRMTRNMRLLSER